jgi:hypothetical protein
VSLRKVTAKTAAFSLVIVAVLTTIIAVFSNAFSEFTYYGKVPDRIWQLRPVDWRAQPACQDPHNWVVYNSPSLYALLALVSAWDDVEVKVINITAKQLIAQATLKSMQPLYLLLRNGTFFKVVASRPITVQLLNYNQTPQFPLALLPPTLHTFYYSVDGTYVGKEFVFVATQGSLTATDYTILAVEPAEITVERDDGQSFSLKLDANGYKYITLSPFRVYRVRSSGNIMVMSGAIPGIGTYETTCFAIPSVQGGFTGTYFLTRAFKAIEWGWDKIRDYGFRVLATGETKIELYDLETQNKVGEYVVPAEGGVTLRPNAYSIALVSEKPVTFMFMHNGSIEIENAGMGGGYYCGYPRSTMFLLLKPGEDTMMQIPSNASVEVYFFAKEDTEVVIDDTLRIRVGADAPYLFAMPGIHKVRSDKEALVQINMWPRYPPAEQGLWFSGYIIPPLESANLKPNVSITLPGVKAPTAYYYAAGAGAVIGVAIALLVMRRRKKEKIS